MKRFYGLAVALSAALLIAALVADVAKAEMVNIYGPVYVAKTTHGGHEKEAKFTFTAPVSGAGVIIVNNGGDSGAKYRVKSAEIALNNTDVARPKDFKANVGVLRYNVELSATNELEVEIESCGNCELSITVQGEAAAPVIRPLASATTVTATPIVRPLATAATIVTAPVTTVTTAAVPAATATAVVTRTLANTPPATVVATTVPVVAAGPLPAARPLP